MNKILLISSAFFLSLISCNNNDDVLDSSPILTSVDFKVVNNNENDLLDKSLTNFSKDLKVYYLENNKWVITNPSNDYETGGYSIYKRNSNYILRLFPKLNSTSETTTLLDWGDNIKPDTILTQYSKFGNGGVRNDRIYLNGKLMNESGLGSDIITIKK